MGISPNGKKWISFGIPGTSLRYFKYMDGQRGDLENYDAPQENDPSIREEPKKISSWKNIK